MYHWSRTRKSWSEGGRSVAPETHVLAKVIEGLDNYFVFRNGRFTVLHLLTDPQVLLDYCARVYSIAEILPVDPQYIPNYSSWLYRLRDKQCGIFIATIDQRTGRRIVPTIADKARGACAAVLRFVTFVGHEMGHVALEHQLADVTQLQPTDRFPSMKPEHEWEAWLFAMHLLGFVVADYSVETKVKENRDGVSDLLLDPEGREPGTPTDLAPTAPPPLPAPSRGDS